MEKTKIVTHNGSFHPDDVFSVAALSLLFKGNIEVVRTRDPKLVKTGDIVLDVGGEYDEKRNRFDHHQTGGAGERQNGIPYASFGLIWKHFGEKLVGDSGVARMIDEKLVQPIDASDNGYVVSSKEITPNIFSYTIDDAIFVFNPTWKEQREEDIIFPKVVEIAETILEREITKARAKKEAWQFVLATYTTATNKRIIVLDHEYPWKEVLIQFPEPLFVIYPNATNGTWGAVAVRKSLNSFENRKSFPAVWAGLRDSALAEVSGVPDAIFCHNKLFLAVAKSKEGALALAKEALIS
ncbi:MAG: hypothetical protein A2836_03420 [Candidatus Taylorbacteria bacterium RIFCSPHIGHO2_01_FULL_45_63]|nr:MAG: hypothetical protein A2836_03420 [Candidatus Taylorbacteria bacterium RIFCSPHIGHO2_01_FULL_45_63]